MLRDLLKDGGLYTLANLLTKGVSLLLIPFYSDYFTQSEYGILAMLGILGAISGAFFSFQIYQGVGRYISEKAVTLWEQQQFCSSGFWFTFMSYAVFLLIALFLENEIINLLSEDEAIKTLTFRLSILSIFLYGIFYTLSVQLKFLRMTKVFSVITFTQAISNIGLILFLAIYLDLRIDSIFIASVITTPIMILVQLFYLRQYIIFYISKDRVKKLLSFSIPLVPAAIAYHFLNYTDRVFIKEMTNSLSEVGLYDMASKFATALSLIIFSFQSALAPIIYRQHADEFAKSQLGRIFRLFISAGTLGCMLLAFFSYETLYLFTQPDYYSANNLMPLFYLSVLITGINLFAPGIFIKNKTTYIPAIVIFAGIVNIGLNYIWIPKYGLMGAAFATLISTTLNYILIFLISQKLYPLLFPKKKSIIVFLVFLILYAFGSYLNVITDFKQPELMILRLILLIMYLLFLFKIKFVNLNQFLDLIKNKRKIAEK